MTQQKTALERIEELEKRCQMNEANIAGVNQIAEAGLQKLISLEQSYAALAKTIYALISSLKESGHVSDEKLMNGIRKLDDDQDRSRIAEMRRVGLIKGAQAVQESSLIVVKNLIITRDNPAPMVLSEYRSIEVASPATPPALRSELIGKKIGETAKVSSDDFDSLYIVQEIYELAEAQRMGENGENQQETMNEQAPQEAAPESQG